jgi:short-subunit dehydrogenase
MQELILLTGASTGLGAEMARNLAAEKMNLILVARNQEKLEALGTELQTQHGITVHVFATDLSQTANAIALHQEMKDRNLQVTMLVNNAGSGLYGHFDRTDLNQELAMIQLNIASVVTLSKLFLQDMKARNYGKIMNISSILAFLPFPYYSVYSATKAFVLSFTETLRAEMEGTKVQISAFCPGPIDTPFNTTEMLKTNGYKANPPADPKWVARKAVQHLLQGSGVKVPGVLNWILTSTPRFSPRWLTLKINKNLASQAS